jgi:hypothetical protein
MRAGLAQTAILGDEFLAESAGQYDEAGINRAASKKQFPISLNQRHQEPEKQALPGAKNGVERQGNEPDEKPILPKPRSVKKAISYQ